MFEKKKKYGGKHLFSCLVQVEPNLYDLIQQYLLQLRVILGPRTMVLQIYRHLHGMNLILPHGIPELMREKPEQFGALDFKVIGCSIHLFSSFFAQHQTRFLYQQSSSTALKQNLPLPTTRSFSLHPPHSMSVRVISMLASGLL